MQRHHLMPPTIATLAALALQLNEPNPVSQVVAVACSAATTVAVVVFCVDVIRFPFILLIHEHKHELW